MTHWVRLRPSCRTEIIANLRRRMTEGPPIIWSVEAQKFGLTYDGLRRKVDPDYRKERNGRRTMTLVREATEAERLSRVAEIPRDTRTITGWLMDDPLPGRSALDRKRLLSS